MCVFDLHPIRKDLLSSSDRLSILLLINAIVYLLYSCLRQPDVGDGGDRNILMKKNNNVIEHI